MNITDNKTPSERRAERKKEKAKKKSTVAYKLFRRLQIKFTVIVSALCIVLVSICFVATSILNVVSMEMNIKMSMDAALDTPISQLIPPEGTTIERPESLQDCSILILVDGEIIATSYYIPLDEETIVALFGNFERGEKDVTINGHNYRMDYKKIQIGHQSGHLVVIMDYTDRSESVAFQGFVLLVGLLAVSVLLVLISWLVSGKVLSPAREAIIKQKDLIANAGHELKTPVTIVNANLDVINSDPQATIEENRNWLDNIHAQTTRMSTLITEMLELSSFESAEYKPEEKEFNIGKLLEGNCLYFEAACFERGLILELLCDRNTKVYSDTNAWTKLIGILLDNAIKYSPDNSKVIVSLNLKFIKKASRHKFLHRVKANAKQTKKTEFVRCNAVLSVTNDGTIPPEETERIFDRFHKVGNRSNSFGLGLAMAKSITEKMNGKIKCESENNVTTFSVTVPVTVAMENLSDDK